MFVARRGVLLTQPFSSIFGVKHANRVEKMRLLMKRVLRRMSLVS